MVLLDGAPLRSYARRLAISRHGHGEDSVLHEVRQMHRINLSKGTSMTHTTSPNNGDAERALFEVAFERARALGRAGMEMAAHLCMLGVTTIKGVDYVRRDSVMNEVVDWRNAFDAAPEVPVDALRAARRSPVADAAGELPVLPTKQYEFTSPKTGWFTAKQMQQYASEAVEADRRKRAVEHTAGMAQWARDNGLNVPPQWEGAVTDYGSPVDKYPQLPEPNHELQRVAKSDAYTAEQMFEYGHACAQLARTSAPEGAPVG